jgi:type IV secretory pathway TraG/TraD family ATPase VirD4
VQTCPVPLPTWLADSGGKGIQLVAVVHGEAQLRTRWHQDGAQVVLDTSGVKVLLPGITDIATLKMASDLAGTAAYREHGQEHDTRHPVMTPDMIRQLPAGHALVIRGGLSPVVARLPMAWKDRAYKTARRRGTAIATVTAPAAAARPALADLPLAAAPASSFGLAAVPDREAEGDLVSADGHAYPWS